MDPDCPKQNIELGILANLNQVCQGATATLSPNGPMPEGAVAHWTINGESVSQAQRFEFGATGRHPVLSA